MLKVLVSHRAALFAIAPEPDAELDAVLHTADQTPLASTSALPSPPKLPSRRPKPLQMLQTPIQGRHSLDVGPRTAPVIPPRPNTSKAAVIAQFDGPAASIVNLGIPATSRSSSNTFGPARVSKPTGSARGGASVTPMSSGLPALSVSSDGGDGYSNGYANSIGNGNGSGTENIEEDGPPIARYFVRKRTGSLSAADSLLSISSLSTSTDGGSLSTPRPGGGSGRPSFSSSEKSGRSTVLGTSSEMEGRMGGLVDRPRPQTSVSVALSVFPSNACSRLAINQPR